MVDLDLQEVLKLCKTSAINGDKIANQKLEQLSDALIEARNQLQQDIDMLQSSDCKLPELSEALSNQLSDIQSSYISISRVSDSDLKNLRKHLSKFSITLFGRTMAGKSTLMEILRHGDGASIGKGAQRTTRDIRTYEWSGLTITDVPGIGAFEGNEDEEIAYNAAKSADLIMFLITDDAPQALEGECFSKIVKLGKPIICVMNVKGALNTERSEKMIKHALSDCFDFERLDSIKYQFMQYAKKVGQEWSNIPFTYVHLKAAFLSQTLSATSPEFAKDLNELSRIDSLKELIIACVQEKGVFYRTKTFIDIIDNPMISTFDSLINQSQENALQARTIIEKRKKLNTWKNSFSNESKKRVSYLITQIRGELRQEIAQFAEEHFSDKSADIAWAKVIKDKKVEERCKRLIEDINSRINQHISDIAREIQTEMRFNSTISADRSLKRDRIIDGRRIWKWTFEIANIGVVIAGIVASIIGASVGLPIAIIGIGVFVAQIFGSFLFKSREIKEKEARKKLEAELMKNIDSICDKLSSEMNRNCDELLYKQIEALTKEMDRLIKVISDLSNVQLQLAWSINEHILDVNKQLFNCALDVLHRKKPIRILKVARLPGNICIIVLPEGERIVRSYKSKLAKLMSERIYEISFPKDVKELISQILNSGMKRKNDYENSFKINYEQKIVHMIFNNTDPNINNRIQLAQQITKYIIME